jgi:NitT/TauT family transport system permease protein
MSRAEHRAQPLALPRRQLIPRRVMLFCRDKPEWIVSPALLAALFLAWHEATHVFKVPQFILPPPEQVWAALIGGLATGPFDQSGFWYHTGITVWEALLGFLLGSSIGAALGFAIAHWRLFERVAYPYIVAFQALPKVAIAPLLVIWFGFGIDGKVLITSVITFFPLLVNAIAGYQSVDPDRIDLARSCNASGWQILWKIVLPSALPFIFAGLNVATVLAILGAIVGEFVGARAGLGMLLMQYDQTMEIAPLFAVLLILGLVGFAMNFALRLIERRCCFWAQRSNHWSRHEA